MLCAALLRNRSRSCGSIVYVDVPGSINSGRPSRDSVNDNAYALSCPAFRYQCGTTSKTAWLPFACLDTKYPVSGSSRDAYRAVLDADGRMASTPAIHATSSCIPHLANSGRLSTAAARAVWIAVHRACRNACWRFRSASPPRAGMAIDTKMASKERVTINSIRENP